MKVLLVNQAFHPDTVATAMHVTDLALQLRKDGFEVSVLADGREYNNRKKRYEKNDELNGIRIYRAASTGFGKRNFLFRVMDAVSFLISMTCRYFFLPKQSAVVVFTSPPMVGVLVMLLARIRGEKCVQWLMDLNPHTAVQVGYLKKNSLVSNFLFWLFNLSMKHSDHVVVLDRWMKNRALEHGADAARVTIVPPWPVQKEAPYSEVARNPFRARYALDKKFVVLYSGNHSLAHPLDTLLETARLLKENRKVVFLFVGAGLRVRDVSRYVDHHNLENVLQLPHQPKEMLRHSLNTADLHVVVMGSKVTGMVHPSKIYGVLATAKPFVFIGPKESHVTDLMREFSGGHHIEHGEAVKLSNIVRRLSDNPRERLEFVSRNPESVYEKFSKEQLISHFSKEVLLQNH